jgi:hypothetical protein
VRYFAQYSASPLRYLLALREESRFYNLQKEEAHIILLYHFLNDKIDLFEPSLHQLLDFCELIFYALHEDMR